MFIHCSHQVHIFFSLSNNYYGRWLLYVLLNCWWLFNCEVVCTSWYFSQVDYHLFVFYFFFSCGYFLFDIIILCMQGNFTIVIEVAQKPKGRGSNQNFVLCVNTKPFSWTFYLNWLKSIKLFVGSKLNQVMWMAT